MPETCCQPHSEESSTQLVCPTCGQKGRTVGRITVASLLKPANRFKLPQGDSFGFCATASCPTVYFANGQPLFNKEGLSVRVGLKESKDPVPLCYCFGFTKQMIEENIRSKGATDIPDRIKAELKKENCYCEITNPQGACCLGNIAATIHEITQRFGGK